MNDWYSDSPSLLDSSEFQNFGSSGGASAFSNGDWAESLSVAFGDSSPSWIPTDFFGASVPNITASGDSFGGAYDGATFATGDLYRSPTEPRSILDQIGDAGSKFKDVTGLKDGDLAKMGFGLIGGIAQGQSQRERDAAVIAARAKEKQMDADAEKEKNAAFSASITGLPAQGLIGKQAQLKRTDGSNVYTNGKIARY